MSFQKAHKVMKDILSLTKEELLQDFKEAGFPVWRAGQVRKWLFRPVRSFNEMTNLPLEMRQHLAEHYHLYRPKVLRRQESNQDGTVKILWELADGNSVETVLMRYRYGNTVCISSQVGCRQGCAFCASTIGGLVRNLSAGEMLDEVLFTELETGLPISHIVLMGIGEPLDNYDTVLRFLDCVHDPEGRNISYRHITLSTCGIPDKIRSLADQNYPVTLTLSLHAPDDETRSRIMPSNPGVGSLLDACRYYAQTTGRRISFEYAMIKGINDSMEQADLLAAHAKSFGAHVNLIPLNYVEERQLKPTDKAGIRAFQKALEEKGVTVTVRRSLGGDIDASCGQLRRKYNRQSAE